MSRESDEVCADAAEEVNDDIEKEQSMSNKPTINTPPQGRTIGVVGDVYRFLATGEDTNGKYAMWEAIVPPGGGPPPHVHSQEEEGFYILGMWTWATRSKSPDLMMRVNRPDCGGDGRVALGESAHATRANRPTALKMMNVALYRRRAISHLRLKTLRPTSFHESSYSRRILF